MKLSPEKYEEVAKKCAIYDMLFEAYKRTPSYCFGDVLKAILGAPEENAADTEDGKC